ncbi:hypothetical protein LSH36_251g05005 [Paralvinella palmiformis]|uniref:Secreted protein n=1 Tax=Paralvinella palmiformis TaxID=53620 RepID=A0AAD9JKS5_9ANNE|nr:hypothetical protein LSH36_251g05005 [Paralvinella palmiformis]
MRRGCLGFAFVWCLVVCELTLAVQSKAAVLRDQDDRMEQWQDSRSSKRSRFSDQPQLSADLFAKPIDVRLPPMTSGMDRNTAKQEEERQFTFKEKNGQGKVVASGKMITSQQLVAEGIDAVRDVFSGADHKQLRLTKRGKGSLASGTGIPADTCDKVCSFCKAVLSMRWAALCENHCRYGGRAYDTCLTVWSFREELERNRPKNKQN